MKMIKMTSDRERFRQLMDVLKSIEKKLDILIKVSRVSMPKPTIGPEEKKILLLCDRKHTIEDMVAETEKKSGNVRKILTQLRKKGLIVSLKSGGKTVFERI